MNIRNRRELKQFASGRLENARPVKKILLIYAAASLGLSALVTVVSYVLGIQVENLGGLSNMGKKNFLSSLQSMLPFVTNLVTMCLELGLLAVMLRVARGQYVSEQTLRLGFDRFWVLLRCNLIKILIYAGMFFVSVYAGVMIYMLTPLSNAAMDVVAPYLSGNSLLGGSLVLDEAGYAQLAATVWPAYLICAVIFALVALPTLYSYRMADYVLIDKPGMGAIAALRASKQMMRRNRLALCKLDLSFWWYYLVLALANVLLYGDLLLAGFGVTLPGNGDIWYFIFYAAYLAALLGIYCLLRGKVEVSYALAYDSLKPEDPKPEGVVLGNIFQM